jgi:hypothetical protein
MKELILFLPLTAIIYLLLPSSPTRTHPHTIESERPHACSTLSSYTSLILLHGILPSSHLSLPLYSRIYLLSD